MAFADGFLEELCMRNDIVDVVSQYVSLTRRGGNYIGLCPFHNEKTPSFSVSADRQFFHCFGCGAGGDVITFLMRAENLDFPDAVYKLAERAGLEIPESDASIRSQKQKKDRLLALHRDAARFYHDCLLSEEGRAAREYLKNRGLSAATITRFGVGFSPNAWDKLLTAMSAAGYTKQELLDAGLAVPNKTGGIYDRFRNRVMFPIIDVRGAVVAFGGRVMDDSTPKYLNSSETLIFNKRRNLFALNLAKKSEGSRMILAEGYMDVIALHQAGFDAAVASLGTSLTPEQARLIAKYKGEVVIAYDADNAGVSAANRAIDLLKEAGVTVRVLCIPNAKDPDEFIKKFGREKFQKLLDGSAADLEYRLQGAKAGLDLTQDEGRVAYLKSAIRLLAEVPNAVEREIYISRAAKDAGVPADAISLEVKRARKEWIEQRKREQEKRNLSPLSATDPAERAIHYRYTKSAVAEEGLLALLMAQPELLPYATSMNENSFSVPLFGQVFNKMRALADANQTFTLTALTRDCTPEESTKLAAVFAKYVGGDETALRDYISIMEKENSAGSVEDLRQTALQYRKKKGYGE